MKKYNLMAIWFAIAVVAGLSTTLYDNSERAIARMPSANIASECIYKQTDPKLVADYLQHRQRLPDYYITKKEAHERGWDPGAGNLCQVLPGRVIGGDRFSNRGGRLPTANNRIWREADINYQCGRRGADRLLYSNDSLIFVTHDHYKSFIQME